MKSRVSQLESGHQSGAEPPVDPVICAERPARDADALAPTPPHPGHVLLLLGDRCTSTPSEEPGGTPRAGWVGVTIPVTPAKVICES